MGQKLINVYIGIKPRQKQVRQRTNKVNEEFHWYLLIDAPSHKKSAVLQDSKEKAKDKATQWRSAYHLHAAEQHVAGTEVLEDQATPGSNATDRVEREHAVMVATIPVLKRDALIEHIEAINTKMMTGAKGYRESCKDFIQRLVFFFTDPSLQMKLGLTLEKTFEEAAQEVLASMKAVDIPPSGVDIIKPPKIVRTKTSLLGWVQSKKDKDAEKESLSKKPAISRPIPLSQVGRAATRQMERQNRQEAGEIVPFILDDPQSRNNKPITQQSEVKRSDSTSVNSSVGPEERQSRSRERNDRSRERSVRHQGSGSRGAPDDISRSVSRSKTASRRTDSREPSSSKPREGGDTQGMLESRSRTFVEPGLEGNPTASRDQRMLESRSKSTSASKERTIRTEARPPVPSRSASEGMPRGRNVAVRIAPRSASEGRHRETSSSHFRLRTKDKDKDKDSRKQKLRISPPLSNPGLAINPVSAVEE